jgi:hypothetical protein
VLSETLTLEAAHSIPLETVEFEGRRYIVRAELGLEEPVPLMVHGNARVSLMLTHAVARRLTGGPVPAVESYGYSERGRASIPAPVLRLGAEPPLVSFDDLPDAAVFDFTDDPDVRVGGMLGLELLRRARTAVDFASDRLLVGVGESSPGLPELLRLGYLQLPVSVAADARLTVDAWFPSIKALLPITPSTVANALTLHRQRFEGRLEMRLIDRPDRSPIGTTPDRFAKNRR